MLQPKIAGIDHLPVSQCDHSDRLSLEGDELDGFPGSACRKASNNIPQHEVAGRSG